MNEPLAPQARTVSLSLPLHRPVVTWVLLAAIVAMFGLETLAGGSTNSLWAHGYCGDDWGPNNSQSLWGDDVLACSEIWKKYGGKEEVARKGMSCSGLD